MDYLDIIKEMKKGDYRPVYFLHGEEPYFIDAITDFAEANCLNETEKAFNQTVIYGKDTNYMQVLDAARRMPMMASRQLVVIKEAQSMRDIASLDSYIKQPALTTVLLVCHKHKKLRMNTKLGKALKENSLVFESKRLYDNQVPAFVKKYTKSLKLDIDEAASQLLAEYLGTDLGKVVNELDKLAINLEPGSLVDVKTIEENIGISRSYNVFELQKALAIRDKEKIYRIVNYFAAQPKKNPFVLVVGSLYNFFSKVLIYHEVAKLDEQSILSALSLKSKFFLKDYRAAARTFPYAKTKQIISILHEYDLKSKGVDINLTNVPEGDLCKEMIYKIIH
jgi:DNA polymerase-3 subunit delta